MKLIQLKYFIAAIETGSLKKAAEQLNITHAALSISLTALEKEMNRHLLFRNHVGCFPTKDGKIVYDIAKKIEYNMKQLEDVKNNCKNNNTISVTVSSQALLNILYRTNFDFSNQYPDVQFQLLENTEINPESLKQSNVDFLFYLSHSQIDVCKNNYLLFSSPYVFCLSKQHPLSYLKQMSFSDFANKYPLLLFSDQDTIPKQLAVTDFYAHYRSFDTIRTLLNDNNCIALIPKIFVNHKFYIFNQYLLSIPITGFKIKLRGYMLHNPNKNFTKMQQNYIEFFVQQFK